ncbi:MAG TPA: hypothetical protein VFA46_01435 [Actinomycetes bacterium]|nr:hypothetical protein [Actinomycetes bacterium]
MPAQQGGQPHRPIVLAEVATHGAGGPCLADRRRRRRARALRADRPARHLTLEDHTHQARRRFRPERPQLPARPARLRRPGRVAPGTGYLEERGFPDSRLFPDLDTYALLPWADATARLLCNPHFFDGAPAPASPRLVMQRLCQQLADEGYQHLAGYEYELYLVRADDRQPPFGGMQIFATLRNSFDEAFLGEVLRAMPQVGVDVITANAEYGPGQMEINFAPATGVAAADHAFTFKNGIKEIARRYGYMASFLTKPYADQTCSGTSLFHQLVRTDGEAVGCDAARDAPIPPWSADALSEGRSHSDTLVGCMVCSTTPSSSADRVSRSTCWRSRALNAAIVRAAS